MERISGPWAILKQAAIYAAFQDVLGAEGARSTIARENIRPFPGARVLDVGCGPCDLLAHLPDVRYLGVDRSSEYIQAAKKKFGNRGEFICADVAELPVRVDQQFDIAIAFGLMHHLTDGEVESLSREVALRLTPNGRFITLDPVFERRQNPVARLLVSMDRGQHVRESELYLALLQKSFRYVAPTLHRRLIRVPYSHLVIESSNELTG